MQPTLFVSFLFFSLSVLSAQPSLQNVYPLSREIHPVTHYQEQAKLWQEKTESEPKASVAWVNFYAAARNMRTLGQHEYDLDKLIADATIAIPNTFEVHYLRYWHSNLSGMDFNELFKAYEIDPNRPEITHDFAHYYELKGNKELFASYCRKLYDSAWYPLGILEWNYNALQSTAQDAVLLTQGDNDTYPAWVLQEAKGIRKDVRVLNIYLLLLHEEYRQRVFAELEIPIDFQHDPKASFADQKEALLDYLHEHLERPLYLGIGMPAAERNRLGEKLYLTGLTLLYSSTRFDNLPVLARNYEAKFRKDNLIETLIPGSSQSLVDYMNMNYIPALAALYDYYQQQERITEMAKIKKLALDIAVRAGRQSEVTAIFAQ